MQCLFGKYHFTELDRSSTYYIFHDIVSKTHLLKSHKQHHKKSISTGCQANGGGCSFPRFEFHLKAQSLSLTTNAAIF